MLNNWLKNLDQDTRVKIEKEIENNETSVVLCDVNSFDDWWYNLDVEICIEIQDELEEIAESCLQ